MAMGTVPCLLWKWWTWWVVLREEETRAATAGHGKTSSARESTSLNRNAGLAHTTGDAALGLDTISNPPSTSTSTSCSIGVGPERIVRPLPLIRHTQEVNILNESWAHDPPAFQPGEERKIQNKNISQKKKKKKIPVWKSQKKIGIKNRKKRQNPSWNERTPRILQQSSADIQMRLTWSLRTTTTPTPLPKHLNLLIINLTYFV